MYSDVAYDTGPLSTTDRVTSGFHAEAETIRRFHLHSIFRINRIAHQSTSASTPRSTSCVLDLRLNGTHISDSNIPGVSGGVTAGKTCGGWD